MHKRLLTILLGSLLSQSYAQSVPLLATPADSSSRMLVVKFKTQMSQAGKRILPNVRNYYVLQQLGVDQLPQLFPGRTAAIQHKRAARQGLQPVDLSGLYCITLPPHRKPAEAIQLLRTDPAIEYAEPLYTNYQPLYVPNDPQAQRSAGAQYHLERIKAYEAWDIEKGNPAVTIGVVDFGCDVDHEDLKDNIQYNRLDPIDGVDNDQDGYKDNYAGWNIGNNNANLLGNPHGSFVSGCAAGTPNNGKGIAGVGLNCRFLPVNGVVSTGGFKGYAGLVYLAEKGCKIINLSWGRIGPFSQYEQDIINYVAINYDVVIVAAAGNDNTTNYYWPASYDHVISVAATDVNDAKALWGGGGSTYNDQVDISAPGLGIYSTWDGSSYGFSEGTSFAAPLVAGAAALLRSHFPTLTATEITERLVGTTDDINQLPANASYAGNLGTGRLNVYRALTDNKAVKLVNTSIKGYQGQPYAWPSQNTELVVHVKNYFGSFSNLQLTLTSNSPYVTITSGSATIGTIAEQDTAHNANAPFHITVLPQTPVNTPISFTLTYQDGTFTRQESFVIVANPDYLNVDVNQLHLTATSKGRIGYNDHYTAEGIGVQYKNQPLLYEAGLLLAASPTQVSNCVRDHTGNFTKEDHFQAAKPIWFDQSNGADFSAGVTFTDGKNPAAIGLEVRQQVYAWKDAPYDKAIIVEYKIKNISGADIAQLDAGLFADWDIYGNYNNQADVDNTRQLGYLYNQLNNNLYAGIQLLTGQPLQYYAFDDVSGINTYDGFTPAEKHASMAGGVARAQSEATAADVTHVVGARLLNLRDGETATVAFAILAGDDLTDLQNGADAIKQQFIQVKTSPLPVAARTDFCINTAGTLTLSNGTKFNLYTRPADATPAQSGNNFTVGTIGKDTTLYVSGLDSLYESAKVAITLQAVRHQADFTANRLALGLDEGHVLELTDQSPGTVKSRWDFGDGSTSDLPTPSHVYSQPGEYTVALYSENSLGCTSSTAKQVIVVQSLIQDIKQAIRLYPNPSRGTFHLEKNNSFFTERLSVTVTDVTGRKILQQEITEPKGITNLLLPRKGVYLMKIEANGQAMLRRLVVM